MLSLFTRRVALSVHRSTAVYTPILSSSASTLRYRRILDGSPHTRTAKSPASPQRSVSTKATAATDNAKSKELERRKKAEKAAALRAKLKAQAEKKKEAARKKLAKEKERKKLAQEKEKKKPKLIKPPPRTLSATGLFFHEVKKPLQEGHTDWHNLSEERRQEYRVRAKALSEKRKEDFLAFTRSADPLDISRYNRHQKSKGGRRIRVKTVDKRSPTSYLRFYQEFRKRPEHIDKPTTQVAKAAGEAWRSLTQEEKDIYKAAPSKSTTD